MTNRKIIENKISFIREQLKLLATYKKYDLNIILNDPSLKGAIERYLYLATQGSIDLAEAVISLKGYRKPTSYTENFEILHEEKILSRQQMENLIKMTGFRNRIAHAYENLKYDVVFDVLQNKLPDIKNFISQIEKKLHLK